MPPFQTFFSSQDWADATARPALATALGIDPQKLTLCQQVHGNAVAVVTPDLLGSGAADNSTRLPAADAMITDVPGAALCILTADCVPVLLADPVHHAVAAIHSGWRGTAADIVGATLLAMASAFGTRGEDVEAFVGPHISAAAYTVGDEVAEQIGRQFAYADEQGQTHMDLGAAVRSQLSSRGVRRVTEHPDCTYLCPEWPSWRRDRTLRRMGSVICLLQNLPDSNRKI